MRLGSKFRILALAGCAVAALVPALSAEEFRLADWEVEQAVPSPALAAVPELTPGDFGLTAFPPPSVMADTHNVEDEALETAGIPVVPIPQPSAAELAAIPDDPPSLIESGKPDPAITSERVAQQLRLMLARGNDRALQAFAAFYLARAYQPLFVADGVLSPRGQAAVTRLSQSGDDGLDPAAFLVSLPEGARNAEAVAKLELALARAVATFAAQASGGRTDPRKLSSNYDVTPPRIEVAEALAEVAKAREPGAVFAALDGFNPPHEGFRKLRAKLIEMRGERREMSDTAAGRRDVLRERNVIANLERWRWLPRELGEAHIWVNIPGFGVDVMQNGRSIHHTRAIAGRQDTQTPIFSHAMSHIIFNPYWHVPPSIVRNSFLGGARRDPGYLARRGIQVVRGGRVVDPATINWQGNVSGYSFRQPPGVRNALGRMKFMFPNRHSVYLHDTPSRNLFGQNQRALSHGCVRVQHPEQLAEVLLNLGLPGEGWTGGRIQAMSGANERTVRFRQNLPIHLVYFTMAVDSTGSIVEYDDIYGHNARIRAALTSARS
ncbi:L,D-transpeptidase family protein [Phreatobacter aquaticus]|nr:L,D-transpeptidase family protein [Phreatobacter aquaticus]